jgi:putative transcriptional regulator
VPTRTPSKKIFSCLRDERLQAGLTQSALASHVGVSRQTIIAMEHGDYIPSLWLALRIAAVIQKPVEAIFNLERKCPLRFV